MSKEASVLKVAALSVSYGKIEIVHSVSFQIKPGEKIGLLGRNGMGKTTLLKGIMGILPTESKEITLFDKSISKVSTCKRSRRGLAYVPQGKDILPNFTVKENLEMGAFGHDVNMEDQLKMVLNYFPALEVHMGRKGGVLSGGLQQQLALGRALMSKPKLLLLDEPTEGIQPNVVNELAGILNLINKELNMPIIVVEQNLKFLTKIIDRYMIMQKGEIVNSGLPNEVTDSVIKQYLAV